jgi:hypothetical protein
MFVTVRHIIHMCMSHSAQMITTALTVGSNGSIVLGNGPTFGILLAILFTHGILCSAGTALLARINIFYVIINRMLLPICQDATLISC